MGYTVQEAARIKAEGRQRAELAAAGRWCVYAGAVDLAAPCDCDHCTPGSGKPAPCPRCTGGSTSRRFHDALWYGRCADCSRPLGEEDLSAAELAQLREIEAEIAAEDAESLG